MYRCKIEGTEMPKCRIVETDNYGGDYPDEKFVGPIMVDWDKAKIAADVFNSYSDQDNRYYKVVFLPYNLIPGFEE